MIDPMVWSAIFTGVIAAETFAYVWLTRRLWQQTKAAAEAAKISADAARSSALTLANLYKPFLGVSSIRVRPQAPFADAWMIDWTLKNFGTLPATHVDASFAWKVAVSFSGAVAQPNSAEMFPQAEIETPILCRISGSLQQEIITGNQILEVDIKIKYSAQS